tara:strand:- start:393 stop:593 length:201 start_codon:yes stop_codon:yes gene_type:complete
MNTKKKIINWFLKPIDDNKILFDYLLNSFEIIFNNQKIKNKIINKKKMFTLYCNWIYFNSLTKVEN